MPMLDIYDQPLPLQPPPGWDNQTIQPYSCLLQVTLDLGEDLKDPNLLTLPVFVSGQAMSRHVRRLPCDSETIAQLRRRFHDRDYGSVDEHSPGQSERNAAAIAHGQGIVLGRYPTPAGTDLVIRQELPKDLMPIAILPAELALLAS